MTYKEYITKTAARFNVSDDDIELILVNEAALIPDADAEVDTLTAKRALCKEFASLIPTYTSLSEGGLSLTVSLDALKLWYDSTCAEIGLSSKATQPKIRNRSNIW